MTQSYNNISFMNGILVSWFVTVTTFQLHIHCNELYFIMVVYLFITK